MKLLRIIIEGQLYMAAVLAVFAGELAFLAWGLWTRRPIVGLIAVFAMLPLMRSTMGAIQACFFRVRSPEGLELDRSEGRHLYGLIDEVRHTIGAPPIHSIAITGGLDASAAAYRPSFHIRQRRVLVLGLPVLTTLSLAELRAVVAHELAHFSSAYDPYAAWVYRTRAGWFALRTALDRRLATPVYIYWLIRWYVPRLNAVSAEIGRRHELTADRVAATVAGSRTAVDALVAFEAAARYADATYWPAIRASGETADQPPQPFTGMLTWEARRISTGDVVDELLDGRTEFDDTHPSLGERVAHLGETARVPPIIERSSGEELLGPALATLAGELDQRWMSRHGEIWHRERAQFLERKAALGELASVDAPTPEQVFRRAELIEVLEGADSALPVYRDAADCGHPAASLAAGRLLLDRLDPTGVALVEHAIDRDESLVPEGCRVLAAYYREIRQELEARRCEWRATRHVTHARLDQNGAADHP